MGGLAVADLRYQLSRKRIVGGMTASQVASASVAAFLLPVTALIIQIGALSSIRPSDLSSAHSALGISVAMRAALALASPGRAAPGMIEATRGCPSGNCKAAAASGTW